jgi:hypothetical protein
VDVALYRSENRIRGNKRNGIILIMYKERILRNKWGERCG